MPPQCVGLVPAHESRSAFFLFSQFNVSGLLVNCVSPPTPLDERAGRQNSLCCTAKLCEKSLPAIPLISRQLSWISDVLAVSPNQRGGEKVSAQQLAQISNTTILKQTQEEPANETFILVFVSLSRLNKQTNKKIQDVKSVLNQRWLQRLFSKTEKTIFVSTELTVIHEWYSWARLNAKLWM